MQGKMMKNILILSAFVIALLLGSCTSSLRYTTKDSSDNRTGRSSERKENTGKKSDIAINKIEIKNQDEDSDSEADIAELETSNKSEEIEYVDLLSGKASYYADKFNGRKTANGEIFDNDKFTAAHKTLPFGTIVIVKNLNNNKTVQVRINDRGPFVEGRIIDLSKRAAEHIGMIRSGVADVEVMILAD